MTTAQMEVSLSAAQRSVLCILADRGVWHPVKSTWGRKSATERTMAVLERHGLVQLDLNSCNWSCTHLGYVWLMHQVLRDLAWVDPFSKATEALFKRLESLSRIAQLAREAGKPVNWRGDVVSAS